MLVKVGAYGFIRFAIPLFPEASVAYAPVLAGLGVVGIIYSSLAAYTQRDLIGVLAYSSIAHLGFVVLGIFAGNERALQGAVVQMFNHGISAGMLFAATSSFIPRNDTASFVHNGFLYVVAGTDSSNAVVSNIQYAPIQSNGTLGSFTTSPSTLPLGRNKPCALVHGGSVYVAGGYNAVHLDDVQIAPLRADGSIGAFATSPSRLASGRVNAHTCAAHAGHLYVSGELGTTPGVSDMEVAPFLSTGGLGAFRSLGANFAARHNHTVAVNKGWLFLTGGDRDAGTSLDMKRAPLLAHGLLGAFVSSGTTLPTARFSHGTVVDDGRLIVLGGTDTSWSPLSEVQVAPLTPSGDGIGAFTPATNLPAPRYGFTTAVVDRALFVLGGMGSGFPGMLDDVQAATLTAQGPGSWSNVGAFSPARMFHGGATWNGYVYLLGGMGQGGMLSNVQVAKAGPGATLGAFNPTTSLPSVRSNLAAVAYNGFLYAVGGYLQAGQTGEILVSPIMANGTLTAWTVAGSLPFARANHTVVAENGFLYVAGGMASWELDDVLAAPILSNGALGPFSHVGRFGSVRESHSMVAAGGNLFILGGRSGGGTSTSNIQIAPLLTPAARGVYSRLVDLGTPSTLSSITVNGTAGQQGSVRLEYRVAGSSAAFGTATDKGVVPLGTAVTLGDTNVRYVFVRLFLDDSLAAAVSVDDPNERDVVDFTLEHAGNLCQNVTCVAQDQCHLAGTCEPGTGICSNPMKTGASCVDSDPCTVSETCQAGICTGKPKVCNASGPCHVAGVCDPQTGVCTNPMMADGTTCNDGNNCTATDTCLAGNCVGKAVECNNSDQCRTVGVCDPTTGACTTPSRPDGTTCIDTNPCSVSAACKAGICVGTPKVCTAKSQCHDIGTCNPSTGECSNPLKTDGAVCSDGNLCTQADTCKAGMCDGSNPVLCVAKDQCHLAGTCLPTTGACSNLNKTEGTACTDGNLCTQTDSCTAGVCVGANPVSCAAKDQCHRAGTCDPATGLCSSPNETDGAACSDGNLCTQTDTCKAGVCEGASPVACAAKDQCHVAGNCDRTTGLCSNPEKADGSPCDDGDLCDQIDLCKAGVCLGTKPKVCPAKSQCHEAGTCDWATGQCSYKPRPDGSACNDGDACTRTDVCKSGVCNGTDDVLCTAKSSCHLAGVCDTTTGKCSNPLRATDAPCDDQNPCTQTDTCQSGACIGKDFIICKAANQCHLDGICDASTGKCTPRPKQDGTACNDGNACTQTDSCMGGTCSGTNPVACLPKDGCHLDGTCDPTSGNCTQGPSKPDGTPCAGGTCSQGKCVEAPDAGLPADAGTTGFDASVPGVDSGIDSGIDSGFDAGVDSGIDSGFDAGVDSGNDSGIHSEFDAGVDSGIDSGSDSGLDGGLTPGADSGVDASGSAPDALTPFADTGETSPGDTGRSASPSLYSAVGCSCAEANGSPGVGSFLLLVAAAAQLLAFRGRTRGACVPRVARR
jgi:hypothetical protein